MPGLGPQQPLLSVAWPYLECHPEPCHLLNKRLHCMVWVRDRMDSPECLGSPPGPKMLWAPLLGPRPELCPGWAGGRRDQVGLSHLLGGCWATHLLDLTLCSGVYNSESPVLLHHPQNHKLGSAARPFYRDLGDTTLSTGSTQSRKSFPLPCSGQGCPMAL